VAKDEKPQVQIADVKLGEVWDKKAAADAPKWAQKALEDGLGRGVEAVSSKPKQGYILKPTLDLEFEEDKGTLIVRVSVIVTDARNSMVSGIKTSASLKKLDAEGAKKKLKGLIDAACNKAGSDAADDIAKAAKGR
jgi:hypothetical protein